MDDNRCPLYLYVHAQSLVGSVPVIRNMLFVLSLLSARSVYGNIIRERQFIIIQRLLFFFYQKTTRHGVVVTENKGLRK